MRRAVTLVAALSVAVLALVAVGGTASAAPVPIQLSLGQGAAFALLGHSCGGIQEVSFVTGFDPVSGYPTGEVDLSTRCGGSGRGGGYHTTTYTASAAVTWDFTGVVVTDAATSPGVEDPTFTATDANGNEIYNSGASAYLLLAPTFTPTPRLTGISVTEGPASGGTSVTIAGTGFTGATQVAFGGTPAAGFTVTGDTSITAVSPATGAGTVDITVTSAGGTSATGPVDLFTLVPAPVVTGLSPASGPLTGGTEVTLSGSGFTDASTVSFGDQPTGFTVVDDSSIIATAPVGEAVDTVTVTVSSIGGTSTGGPDAVFAYTAPTPCGGTGCSFTSPDTASATTGVPFAFTVSATGGVVPTFKEKGKRPKGVTFVNNGDGTATLSGVPTATTTKPAAGTYPMTITATFAVGSTRLKITQALVLTVS